MRRASRRKRETPGGYRKSSPAGSPQPAPDGRPYLGGGGEGQVWLCRDLEQAGRPVALKLYTARRDTDPAALFDVELRNRLGGQRFRPHVPELFGYGLAARPTDSFVAWEAMEYFPDGSLRDLNQREGSPGHGLDDALARALIEALVEAVDFWEREVGLRPIDLSPSNVMFRSTAPFQAVLPDFGGLKGTGLSQSITDLQVKLAYMAPEALGNGNHARSPYWSLGIMVYEMFTGRSFIPHEQEKRARIILATHDLDMSHIADTRRRLLVEGLVTRNPDHRWGADEVRGWLAGRSPGLQRSMPAPEAPRIRYDGRDFDDPSLLSATMTRHPDQAARWLRNNVAPLLAWLDRSGHRAALDPVDLAGVEGSESEAHLAVSRIAAAFTPNLRPQYRGHPIDAEGLARLAADPSRAAFVREIFQSDVLRLAAARHSCSHRGCRSSGQCRHLLQINDIVPLAASQVMERLDRLGHQLARDDLARQVFTLPLVRPDEYDRGFLRCVWIAASPQWQVEITRRARTGRMPQAPWWRAIEAELNSSGLSASRLSALVIADEIGDPARGYRDGQDAARGGRRRPPLRARLRGLRRRLPSRRVPSTVIAGAPAWVPWLFLVLSPIGMVEPLYLYVVQPDPAPLDAGTWRAAQESMTWLAGYTTWAPDGLTAWLLGTFPSQATALLAYPVALLVCLGLTAALRGRTPARGWVGAAAACLGLVAAAGLTLHLIAQNFYPLWMLASAPQVRTLGALAVTLAVAVALVRTGRPIGRSG